mgnify:CR=1 FL=1
MTYELCFDSRDAEMLIYRSIPAGVCGPFSETVPCRTRGEAERIAFGMGYLVASDWDSHTNYDSALLVQIA